MRCASLLETVTETPATAAFLPRITKSSASGFTVLRGRGLALAGERITSLTFKLRRERANRERNWKNQQNEYEDNRPTPPTPAALPSPNPSRTARSTSTAAPVITGFETWQSRPVNLG